MGTEIRVNLCYKYCFNSDLLNIENFDRFLRTLASLLDITSSSAWLKQAMRSKKVMPIIYIIQKGPRFE